MIIPKSAFYDDLELDQVLEEAIESPVTRSTTAAVKAVGNALTGNNGVLSAANAVLSVKADVGKNSITRMGKDSIQCFPAVFSASIDLDDSIAIAKMLEKYYASLLVSIYSLRPAVSLKEYGDISQYLKTIHNNTGALNVKKAKDFITYSKEGIGDTSDVAEEGAVSDRFSALANIFGVTPTVQEETPVVAKQPKGGFLTNGLFPWTKKRKDFKPDLNSAIKNTTAAIHKVHWAIDTLNASGKRLDKRYTNAMNAIRSGVDLALKDLMELEAGLSALNAMKSIGSNEDRIKQLSYSSNFKVIFDQYQLKEFCQAIERFVEHYKHEAEYHIFNGKEEEFATSLIGGGMEAATKFSMEVINKKIEEFKKMIKRKRYKFAAEVFSGGRPVVAKSNLHDIIKRNKEMKAMFEKQVAEALKCKVSSHPAEDKINSAVDAYLGDLKINIAMLDNGTTYLESINLEDRKDTRYMSSSTMLMMSKDMVDTNKQRLEFELKALKKLIEDCSKPAIEAFISDNEFCLVEDEPSGLCIDANIFVSTDPDMAFEGLGVEQGALNMGTVNNISLPFKRSEFLLNDRISMSKATEADATFNSVAVVGSNQSTMLTNKMSGKEFKPAGYTAGLNPRMSQQLIEHNPTMINATFYLHGTGSDGSGGFSQTVNLGVKCSVRQETSDVVINNLIEGSKSSNPIFKFISWSRGEYGLVKDLIFNVGEIKKKYKDKSNGNTSILAMSKDRKAIDDITKFTGNRVLPFMTLIVTDYEVAQAAQVSGVDLSNPRNAKAFMDNYYLLGFGIYNSSTKKLSIMYDGDETFESLSMTYIQSQQKSTMNINKDFANLISMR